MVLDDQSGVYFHFYLSYAYNSTSIRSYPTKVATDHQSQGFAVACVCDEEQG